MTATIIVTVKITNAEKMAEYREVARGALAKHKGQHIASGPVTATLSGPQQDVSIAAIIQFPTEQAAHDWINDPELAHIHDLRNAAGDVTILLANTGS